MNFLVLGRGKTGSLVAQYAHDRHHHVRVLGSEDNRNGKALTPDLLRDVNTVIDFTTPASVLENIPACVREKKNMVVGTTGWQAHAASVRAEVEKAGVGFLHGSYRRRLRRQITGILDKSLNDITSRKKKLLRVPAWCCSESLRKRLGQDSRLRRFVKEMWLGCMK